MRKNIHTGWVVSGLVRDWLPPERVELGPRGECFPLSLYFWPSQPAPTLFTSIVLSSKLIMAVVIIIIIITRGVLGCGYTITIVLLIFFTGVEVSNIASGAMQYTYMSRGTNAFIYLQRPLMPTYIITFK